MKRRDFLWTAAAAVVAPSSVLAQQAQLPLIGVLVPVEPEPVRSLIREGLARAGYVNGKNARIEFRAAQGSPQLLAEQARELVRLNAAVIIAHQTPAVSAAQAATGRIPIVMAGAADPIAMGFVASLARPGGNITGMAGLLTAMAPKLFELLKEAIPQMKRVVVLGNGVDPFTKVFLPLMESAARKLDCEAQLVTLGASADFAAAYADAARRRAHAVIVQPSLPRKPAVELMIKHRLATVSPARAFAEEGGLMSYSAVFKSLFYGAAVYVDKILKGASPADLPVQQPTHYELVINLKAAKLLGITFPQSILLRANKMIE